MTEGQHINYKCFFFFACSDHLAIFSIAYYFLKNDLKNRSKIKTKNSNTTKKLRKKCPLKLGHQS